MAEQDPLLMEILASHSKRLDSIDTHLFDMNATLSEIKAQRESRRLISGWLIPGAVGGAAAFVMKKLGF